MACQSATIRFRSSRCAEKPRNRARDRRGLGGAKERHSGGGSESGKARNSKAISFYDSVFPLGHRSDALFLDRRAIWRWPHIFDNFISASSSSPSSSSSSSSLPFLCRCRFARLDYLIMCRCGRCLRLHSVTMYARASRRGSAVRERARRK